MLKQNYTRERQDEHEHRTDVSEDNLLLSFFALRCKDETLETIVERTTTVGGLTHIKGCLTLVILNVDNLLPTISKKLHNDVQRLDAVEVGTVVEHVIASFIDTKICIKSCAGSAKKLLSIVERKKLIQDRFGVGTNCCRKIMIGVFHHRTKNEL